MPHHLFPSPMAPDDITVRAGGPDAAFSAGDHIAVVTDIDGDSGTLTFTHVPTSVHPLHTTTPAPTPMRRSSRRAKLRKDPRTRLPRTVAELKARDEMLLREATRGGWLLGYDAAVNALIRYREEATEGPQRPLPAAERDDAVERAVERRLWTLHPPRRRALEPGGGLGRTGIAEGYRR